MVYFGLPVNHGRHVQHNSTPRKHLTKLTRSRNLGRRVLSFARVFATESLNPRKPANPDAIDVQTLMMAKTVPRSRFGTSGDDAPDNLASILLLS
jgi:hypothetical protein